MGESKNHACGSISATVESLDYLRSTLKKSQGKWPIESPMRIYIELALAKPDKYFLMIDDSPLLSWILAKSLLILLVTGGRGWPSMLNATSACFSISIALTVMEVSTWRQQRWTLKREWTILSCSHMGRQTKAWRTSLRNMGGLLLFPFKITRISIASIGGKQIDMYIPY